MFVFWKDETPIGMALARALATASRLGPLPRPTRRLRRGRIPAPPVAPDARRRALEANFTGDFAISVDPDDGSYHLSDYAPIRCLSPDGMLAWLESFSSEILRLRTKFTHFSG